MGGYCSRLHYFSEWIADNERRGHVRNITRELGGIELEKTLNFMSTHRDAYPRLVESEENYECILAVESRLRDLPLYYIPQDSIHTIYDRLQTGDIIATATDIEGLDVTHTGLVYKQPDGGTGLIHASLSGEVKISLDLESYIQGVKQQIGIIVARPADPPR